MSRQATDDGRWFETKTARRWEEATRWNGQNHISCATGSQWEHETLYLTKGGRWILHHSSQWQGSEDSWSAIEPQGAAAWLMKNGHDEPQELAAETAALEV